MPPLVGVLVGALISFAAVVFQQRRESDREVEARRVELERDTLLAVQEAITAVEAAIWNYGDWAMKRWSVTGNWPRPSRRFDLAKSFDPSEFEIEYWPELTRAHRQLRLLATRIFDKQLRAEIEEDYEGRYKLIVSGPADDEPSSVETFIKSAAETQEKYVVDIGRAFRRTYGLGDEPGTDF